MSKSIIHILVILSVSVMLASCGSSRKSVATATYGQGKPGTFKTENGQISLSPVSDAVVSEARKWLGTPYKYGGNDTRGIDCSGLVLQVYQRALSIDLPRNSRAQHDFCSPSGGEVLVPGDLLFFATGKDRNRVSHVGIYVGGNNMIHASASKGVIVSDFTAPYYQRTFAGARYVGEYHAMLEPSRKQRGEDRKPRAKPRREPKQEPKPMPRQEPRPQAEPPAETPEPAAGLLADEPKPATPQPAASQPTAPQPTSPATPEPERAQQPEPAVTAIQVAPVVSADTPATEEPSADDARASVLGSLSETPLH